MSAINIFMQKEALLNRLETVAHPLGLEVFDIESPPGFLKIFITKVKQPDDKSAGKVDISDCAKLSRVILDLPDVEELLPGESQLEVSSPGINRKLTSGKHFRQAIGERVRLVVRKTSCMGENKSADKEVIRGEIVSFDGQKLELQEEVKKTIQQIDYENITDARIDFNFNN